MAEPYKLYALDAQGHITRADVIDVTNDEEAVAIAQQRARGEQRDAELWQLDRRVAVIGVSTRMPRVTDTDVR